MNMPFRPCRRSIARRVNTARPRRRRRKRHRRARAATKPTRPRACRVRRSRRRPPSPPQRRRDRSRAAPRHRRYARHHYRRYALLGAVPDLLAAFLSHTGIHWNRIPWFAFAGSLNAIERIQLVGDAVSDGIRPCGSCSDPVLENHQPVNVSIDVPTTPPRSAASPRSRATAAATKAHSSQRGGCRRRVKRIDQREARDGRRRQIIIDEAERARQQRPGQIRSEIERQDQKRIGAARHDPVAQADCRAPAAPATGSADCRERRPPRIRSSPILSN